MSLESAEDRIARSRLLRSGARLAALSGRLACGLALLATLAGCASEPVEETQPAAPTTPREEAPVSELPVTVTRFELQKPEGSQATAWEAGLEGLLRVWIKNEGEALKDYPSVVIEPLGAGLVIKDSEVVLYGIGDSTQVRYTVQASADSRPGTELRARVRVFANSADLREGRDPVGRGELSLEVGQAFAE